MDEKKKSISSNALFYGALVGGAGIVYSLILFVLGLSMNKWLGNISFLFYIGGMIYGTLQYRKENLQNAMTYSQAVGSAFLIGLYASIILMVYTFIYFKFIDPGMIDAILAKAREDMTASGQQLTEDQIEQALSITRIFTNAYILPIFSLFTSAILSIIIALLVAIFLKKEETLVPGNN
jgi:hypothetical protein